MLVGLGGRTSYPIRKVAIRESYGKSCSGILPNGDIAV